MYQRCLILIVHWQLIPSGLNQMFPPSKKVNYILKLKHRRWFLSEGIRIVIERLRWESQWFDCKPCWCIRSSICHFKDKKNIQTWQILNAKFTVNFTWNLIQKWILRQDHFVTWFDKPFSWSPCQCSFLSSFEVQNNWYWDLSVQCGLQ